MDAFYSDSVFMNHLSAKKMYARHNANECDVVLKIAKILLKLLKTNWK